MHDINWDILKVIIAVADNGSAVAAAAKLGVNSTTVQRRIVKFESENGVQLFDRRQQGYTPTAAGRALVEAARGIEDSVNSIYRDILGLDLRLEGRLAITTTDTILQAVLPKHLSNFAEKYPKITLDISVTNSRLDLSRQDADVAIRPSMRPPDELFGQRVSGLGFGIYGLHELVGENKGDIFRNAEWVGVGQILADSPVGHWFVRHVPQANIVMQADSFPIIAELAKAGCGLAMLPCCLGDTVPALRRLPAPTTVQSTSIWVLTHADTRHAAKVKAFTDFISTALRSDSRLLEGSVSS
jgi:DNA-binding transcriptional LysR family regulator